MANGHCSRSRSPSPMSASMPNLCHLGFDQWEAWPKCKQLQPAASSSSSTSALILLLCTIEFHLCPSDSICPSSFVLKYWCRGFQRHRAKPKCWPNSVRVSIESTDTSDNGSETDQKRTAAARGARMSSTLTPEQLLSADWRQALPIFVQSADLCPSAWVVTTCRASLTSNLESSSPSRTSLAGTKFHATVHISIHFNTFHAMFAGQAKKCMANLASTGGSWDHWGHCAVRHWKWLR